jgi:hypothetical protein
MLTGHEPTARPTGRTGQLYPPRSHEQNAPLLKCELPAPNKAYLRVLRAWIVTDDDRAGSGRGPTGSRNPIHTREWCRRKDRPELATTWLASARPALSDTEPGPRRRGTPLRPRPEVSLL